MKYVNEYIDKVFDLSFFNVIVLENKNLFYKIIYDLIEQINTGYGNSRIINDDDINLSKNVELIYNYFDLNFQSKK